MASLKECKFHHPPGHHKVAVRSTPLPWDQGMYTLTSVGEGANQFADVWMDSSREQYCCWQVHVAVGDVNL